MERMGGADVLALFKYEKTELRVNEPADMMCGQMRQAHAISHDGYTTT